MLYPKPLVGSLLLQLRVFLSRVSVECLHTKTIPLSHLSLRRSVTAAPVSRRYLVGIPFVVPDITKLQFLGTVATVFSDAGQLVCAATGKIPCLTTLVTDDSVWMVHRSRWRGLVCGTCFSSRSSLSIIVCSISIVTSCLLQLDSPASPLWRQLYEIAEVDKTPSRV